MRNALLISAAWLGVVQGALATGHLQNAVSVVTVAALSIAIGMRAFHAGGWTKGVDDGMHALTTSVDTLRGEMVRRFGQVDQRLDAIDHTLALLTEQLARGRRRQTRNERRLERLEAVHSAEHLQ